MIKFQFDGTVFDRKTNFENLSEHQQNLVFKEKFYTLAHSNNIVIRHLRDGEHIDLYYEYGRPSADAIFIVDGGISLSETFVKEDRVQYELAFHELLHILSVPPNLRHLMSHDTEYSYSLIRKEYSDIQRLSTESAVLGLQSLLYEKMNVTGWLRGSFFTGYLRSIGDDKMPFTDVKDEWRIRGKKLLKLINTEFI